MSDNIAPAAHVVRVPPSLRVSRTTTRTRLIKVAKVAAPHGSVLHRPAYVGVDRDVLVIEDLARIFRSTVDLVRRMPRDLLPAYHVGRRLLYLREDVITYIRGCRVRRGDADRRLDEAAAEVLGSPTDSERERS